MAKEKFARSKPHINVGIDHGKTTLTAAITKTYPSTTRRISFAALIRSTTRQKKKLVVSRLPLRTWNMRRPTVIMPTLIDALMEQVDKYIPMPVRVKDKPFLMPSEDIFSIQGRL